MIRVLLADDHTILRHGIRRILEKTTNISVVAEAASGLEAVRLGEKHQPDVAIMDIGMPELNGIDATVQILKRSPKTSVLILSMFSDEQYVTRMVRAGAKGYLTKDTVERDLIQAIRAVDAGQSFFSPAICKILLHNVSQELNGRVVEDRYESLTDRERQVFQLLAEGKTNKGVAEMLNLSLHTVETHRFRVMEKLAVHSSAELVIFAVRRGLLSYLAPPP